MRKYLGKFCVMLSILFISIFSYSNKINSIIYRDGNITVNFSENVPEYIKEYDKTIPLLKITLNNVKIARDVTRTINIQDEYMDTILTEEYEGNTYLLVYNQDGTEYKVNKNNKQLIITIEKQTKLPKRNFTIILDAGHGGKDNGASGNGYKEKNIALDVVMQLYNDLKRDYNVILTRSDDTFIPLNERAKIGNDAGANLFVSVHLNASKNKNANGAEVFYFSKNPSKYAAELSKYENSFDIEGTKAIESSRFIVEDILYGINQQQSASIASSVLDAIVDSNGIQYRRVAGANFAVLRGSKSPAILIELGFITNKEDIRLYTSRQGQNSVAVAIANAIRKHF